MAFADYFAKNEQSAALLLQGVDATAFKETLEREVVAIVVDELALKSAEGRATLDLSVRLICRLYPAVAFVAVGTLKAAELASCDALAKSINAKIDIRPGLVDVTRCLVLGGSRPRIPKGTRPFVVYAGSSGWLARLSTKGPVGSGPSANPFGAGAAACLAVANIFRATFKAHLPRAKPDREITFSCLAMAPVTLGKVRNPSLKKFALGEAFLAGVGAIGNGFVWAIGRSQCSGTLHVIDGEALAQSNLQRYAMTVESDIEKPKVELAKGWLSGTKINVAPHAMHWEDFAKVHGNWAFDHVAVAVDTARARINVQASLPRVVFNSWTQAGEVGLSRHGFIGPGACLACLYMPDRVMPSKDELITRALHLEPTRDRLLDIRRRIQLAVPTERAFLDEVAAAAKVPIDELLAFENKTLDALYVQGICGGAVITLAKGGGAIEHAEVPMAFQSTLAGVLLAADLVAERLGLRARLPTRTQINLLSAVPPIPSNGQAKRQPTRCFCTDADFIASYRTKYPDRGAKKAARRRTVTKATAT